MASAKIFLFTHKTLKDGDHPVVLQLINDRKRKMISLGTAFENEWNFEKEIPNTKHPNVRELRSLIRKKKIEASGAIIELDEFGKPYTVDDIAEKLNVVRSFTFFKEYSQQLIQQMKRVGQNGNARAYQDAQNAFIKFNNEQDIDFKNITPKKINQFENYLLIKGLRVNSISFYLRTIRAIYNKAIKDELINEKYYPFKNYKIKTEKTIKRALNKDDLRKIVDADLKNNYELELSRDVFLFSFYNRGMSFIDVFYLDSKMISDDRIEYRRRKTHQLFSIKLTNESKEIIEKYKGLGNSDYVFPVIAEKDEYRSYRTGLRLLNKRLKKIGESLELEIPLTSYVARHSWATIAKKTGVSTSVISEGLGHQSELTTQIYLDSFDNDVLDSANEKIISL
jgi:integrase